MSPAPNLIGDRIGDRIGVRVERRDIVAGVERIELVPKAALPVWIAGQYLFCLSPDESDVRIPFSIASPPELRDRLVLHYQPAPDNVDSRAMDALLDRGEFAVELPFGTAVPEPEDGSRGPLWLIGFGTGIAPMTAIATSLATRGGTATRRRIRLAWGLGSAGRDYLGTAFDALATGPEGCSVERITDDAPGGPLVGRLADWLKDESAMAPDRVLLAGPWPAVDAAARALLEAGLPRQRLRSDMLASEDSSR